MGFGEEFGFRPILVGVETMFRLSCIVTDFRRKNGSIGSVLNEAMSFIGIQLAPGPVKGLVAQGKSSPPQHSLLWGLLEKWHIWAKPGRPVKSSKRVLPLGFVVLQMWAQGWLQLGHWQCFSLVEWTSCPTYWFRYEFQSIGYSKWRHLLIDVILKFVQKYDFVNQFWFHASTHSRRDMHCIALHCIVGHRTGIAFGLHFDRIQTKNRKSKYNY